jgi:hypothetical protein
MDAVGAVVEKQWMPWLMLAVRGFLLRLLFHCLSTTHCPTDRLIAF